MGMLESIIKNHGFSVRFEKGNFQSGYCLLNHKKVVIINKFFDNEARFNALTEIVAEIPIDAHLLDDAELRLLKRAIPEWKKMDLFNSSSELVH